jgi:hypothetical protein
MRTINEHITSPLSTNFSELSKNVDLYICVLHARREFIDSFASLPSFDPFPASKSLR